MTEAARTPAPARPSATIMLVRDGMSGLEIFMVKRDRMVDLASGALIFPGGKIDPDDSNVDVPWGTSVMGPEPQYWVAAVRETFEEAGVLVAQFDGANDVIEALAAADISRRHRNALNAKSAKFSAIMSSERLVPALDHMVHFAHWVSPVTLEKRFDTHFFLVAMPDGQIATHDGQEAVSSVWKRPADLLAEAEAGTEFLVPATRLNIELLSDCATVDAAMREARARHVTTVMPKLVKDATGLRAVIPSNAGYRTTEVYIKRA